eukprot:g7232.t1
MEIKTFTVQRMDKNRVQIFVKNFHKELIDNLPLTATAYNMALLVKNNCYLTIDTYQISPNIIVSKTGNGVTRYDNNFDVTIPVKGVGFVSSTIYKCIFSAEGVAGSSDIHVSSDAQYVSSSLIECPWSKSIDPRYNKVRLNVHFFENKINENGVNTLDRSIVRYAFNYLIIYFIGTMSSIFPDKGVNTGGLSVKIYGSSFLIDSRVDRFECVWTGVKDRNTVAYYETRTPVLSIFTNYVVCQTPSWRYTLQRQTELTIDEGKSFLSIERNGEVEFLGSKLLFQFHTTIYLCPTGHSHLGGACVPCSPGWYNNGTQLSCSPCAKGSYSNAYSASKCTKCNDLNHVTFDTGSKSKFQCVCKKYFYPSSGTTCNNCPNYEDCIAYSNDANNIDSNTIYYLKKGFWLDSNAGETFPIVQKCIISENCLGGQININKGIYGKCAVGYDDHLCSSCAVGYYKLTQQCIECPNYHAVYLIAAPVFVVGICCLLLFLPKFSNKQSAVTNLLFNGLQFIASLATIRAFWPPLVHSLLGNLTVWNFNIDLFRVECFVPLNYIAKTTLYMLAPFVMILILWLLYFISTIVDFSCCSSCCRGVNGFKNANNDKQKVKSRAVLGTSLILQFSYIIVSLHVLSGYICIKTEANTDLDFVSDIGAVQTKHETNYTSNYRLATDLNIVCSSKEYLDFKPYLILGTIFYPVGMILLLLINTCPQVDNNDREYTDASTHQLLKLHLTSIYVNKFYFWEGIIMLKRLFVVCALTLLRMYTDIQLLLIMLITFLYLSLVLYARPYVSPSHNYLSFTSNMTQFMVAFAGLVFYLSKKARTNYCLGIDSNGNTNDKHDEKLQMGGEMFMYIFLVVYFILLCLFLLYQMKDYFFYVCTFRWVNIFKSFEKLDSGDGDDNEPDIELTIGQEIFDNGGEESQMGVDEAIKHHDDQTI